MYEQLLLMMESLGWDPSDEIDIEFAGTQVSGIDVGENYNKKWQTPMGEVKLNKDAFIIIKNQSRRDLSKTTPFAEGEFKPKHELTIHQRDVGEGQQDRRGDVGPSVDQDTTTTPEVSNSVE